MGFLSNDFKPAAAPTKPKTGRRSGGHIPIASLNVMGCKVCPRDKLHLKTPKMEPDGNPGALIYLLSSGPTREEDNKGNHWTGVAARAVLSKLHDKGGVRYGGIVQCAPAHDADERSPDQHELECCRGRVVSDIEETKPLVVVGMGDAVLNWATGLGRNTNPFRGTLIATKIGKHVCWYYPILYPNYIHGKQRAGLSEFELTMEHDIGYIEGLIENGLEAPTVYEAPYDRGIELITGQDAGDMNRLEDALHDLLQFKSIGLDIEANGLKPHMLNPPHIWTAAVGTFDRTVAFAIEHPDGWGTETRHRKVMGMFGDFVQQSGRKRCHHAAFEMEWMAWFFGNQILRRTEWDDTMAMGHVFDERKGTKSLDTHCRVHFGFFLKDQSPVDVTIPNWVERYSIKETLRYNALDTKWTDKLSDLQLPIIKADKRAQDNYESYVRLAPTLVLTTARGLPVDFEYAGNLLKDIEAKCLKVEDDLRKLPEIRRYTSRFGSFDITNNHHIMKLMKDVLKRPEIEVEDWTGKVSYTTGEEVLAAMPASEVPSAHMILAHRQLNRNDTTYLRPLMEGKLAGKDGIIHSEYSSMHTSTGRLSSPMHNWPKHKHIEVRGAVAPGEGRWLVAADQGQIEFRVAGMLSLDENLVKYCWTGYDVHKFWAERMVQSYGEIKDWVVEEFEIDWDEKGMKTLRQVAKNNWVFPQLFGATTRSCAANCHIPEDIADDLGAEFWDEFKGVKKWQERTLKSYERNLYVETLGGFRRRGPLTLNEVINAPIQGTACEIVVEAMNVLSERSQLEDNVELQPAFNGHDDLTFIVGDERLKPTIDIIAMEMCKPRFDYINVPLIVEVSVGPRWHQLEEIGKFSSEHLYHLRNPYK